MSGDDFGDVTRKWTEALNELIAKKVGSPDWVRVAYGPPDKRSRSTTGTLWIDRLTCLEVTFQLQVTFVGEQRSQRFEIRYSAKGTDLRSEDPQWAVNIPPFDPSRSNKCRPEEPPADECTGMDLTVKFTRAGVLPNPIVLTAGRSLREPYESFVWEVQDGVPPLANGAKAAFGFSPTEPTRKLVRLTAYTKGGCRAIAEQEIDIKTPAK